MTSARLVLLRHGRTDDNLHGLLTGRRDVPLNAEGRAQALTARALLGAYSFDKVYSSPLRRAFDTAALALGDSAAVETAAALSEMDFGIFTGVPVASDAALAAFMQAGRDYRTPFPEGESEAQAVARVAHFYNEAIYPRLCRGENVLVVTHEGVIRGFDIILGRDAMPEKGQSAPYKSVPNAVPLVHEFENGRYAQSFFATTAQVPAAPKLRR